MDSTKKTQWTNAASTWDAVLSHARRGDAEALGMFDRHFKGLAREVCRGTAPVAEYQYVQREIDKVGAAIREEEDPSFWAAEVARIRDHSREHISSIYADTDSDVRAVRRGALDFLKARGLDVDFWPEVLTNEDACAILDEGVPTPAQMAWVRTPPEWVRLFRTSHLNGAPLAEALEDFHAREDSGELSVGEQRFVRGQIGGALKRAGVDVSAALDALRKPTS